MMMQDTIISDYGRLFPFEVKREDIAKASFSDFESTTGVKLASKSLGEVLRGANDFKKNEGSTRPTVLIIDDIDTTDSVKNRRIIDDNWRKITGETIDSLDQFRRRVIVLGNTIAEDGILPRFKRMAEGKTRTWKVFRQPLINPDGSCAWPAIFTPEVIENLKTTPLAFQQNYELIPYKNGQTLIPRTSFKFAPRMPEGCRIVFAIDPAFSEKTNTDAMALAVVGHIGVQRYVAAVYAFEGAEKNEESFCNFVEQLYHSQGCNLIRIENNNGGGIIARMLQRRNLAVEVITASKDKFQRTREQEGRFGRGEVYFLPGTEAAQDQIADFPNADHDDMVDAVVYGLG
jgi:phage terminase large subunit-like protein